MISIKGDVTLPSSKKSLMESLWKCTNYNGDKFVIINKDAEIFILQ